MSAAQDAARLVSLAVAHNDATETLLERTIAGTASPWDARAVTAAFDAMDATRHALKLAHFPDARAVLVDLGRVIVEPPDAHHARAHTGKPLQMSQNCEICCRHPRARGEVQKVQFWTKRHCATPARTRGGQLAFARSRLTVDHAVLTRGGPFDVLCRFAQVVGRPRARGEGPLGPVGPKGRNRTFGRFCRLPPEPIRYWGIPHYRKARP